MSTRMDMDVDWDVHKENMRPVREGRNLATVGKQQTERRRADTVQQELTRRRFWAEIENYIGDDPIEPWLKLQRWIRRTFPNGEKSNELLQALEKGCRHLHTHTGDRYKNDHRYLKMWLTYADECRGGEDIFRFMMIHGIGQYCSQFYEAYGCFLEVKGRYSEAAQLYEQGLERRPVPFERFQQKHQSFLSRQVHRAVNGTAADEQEPAAAPAVERRAFSAIGGSGGAHDRPMFDANGRRAGTDGGIAGVVAGGAATTGARRLGNTSSNVPSQAAGGEEPEVFQDAELQQGADAAARALLPRLPQPETTVPGALPVMAKLAQRERENRRAAASWARSADLFTAGRSGGAAAGHGAQLDENLLEEDFDVFEDGQGELPPQAPRGGRPAALRMQLDAPDAAELSADPLRFFKQPERERQAARSAGSGPGEQRQQAEQQNALADPLGADTRLPSDAHGLARSKDEARAERFARQPAAGGSRAVAAPAGGDAEARPSPQPQPSACSAAGPVEPPPAVPQDPDWMVGASFTAAAVEDAAGRAAAGGSDCTTAAHQNGTSVLVWDSLNAALGTDFETGALPDGLSRRTAAGATSTIPLALGGDAGTGGITAALGALSWDNTSSLTPSNQAGVPLADPPRAAARHAADDDFTIFEDSEWQPPPADPALPRPAAADDEFEIREDTDLLPEAPAASAAGTGPLPVTLASPAAAPAPRGKPAARRISFGSPFTGAPGAGLADASRGPSRRALAPKHDAPPAPPAAKRRIQSLPPSGEDFDIFEDFAD